MQTWAGRLRFPRHWLHQGAGRQLQLPLPPLRRPEEPGEILGRFTHTRWSPPCLFPEHPVTSGLSRARDPGRRHTRGSLLPPRPWPAVASAAPGASCVWAEGGPWAVCVLSAGGREPALRA